VSGEFLPSLVRTVVKIIVVVIVTLLVLTAIGWGIRALDGPDEDDVTTVERR
jgi:hypothetical protein